jgi:hypothetical protein
VYLPGAGVLPFEVKGGNGDHWKYKADGPGITKLDVDWKGAKFKYKESDVPVELESELISSAETVLTMKYKTEDAGGAFTVMIDDQVFYVSELGVVSCPSCDPGVMIDVKKDGKKVEVTLPFALVESSTISFGSDVPGSVLAGKIVNVAEHYTHSVGRFKLEADSGSTLEDGATSLPREVFMDIGVGGPRYPGSCGANADELKVHSQKWKSKK